MSRVTSGQVTAAVAERPAVTPTLLWRELRGGGDFPPLWLYDHLRRLGYGPLPAGFWWRSDLPLDLMAPLAARFEAIEEAFPDEEGC